MESLMLLAIIITFFIIVVPITCAISGVLVSELGGWRSELDVVRLPFNLEFLYHKSEPKRSLMISITIIIGIIISAGIVFCTFWITPFVAIVFAIVRTLLYFFKDRNND